MPPSPLANRAYYSATIATFLDTSPDDIYKSLVLQTPFAVETTDRTAWLAQIDILQSTLAPYRNEGQIYFEFTIPRLGKRIDVLLILHHLLFILEFKVGESTYPAHALDQAWDYALDLKNFHESSHHCPIVPLLVATEAPDASISTEPAEDGVTPPLKTNRHTLASALTRALEQIPGPIIDPVAWAQGRYCPTPTIVEAATALYGGHSVADISRSDASAINLSQTSKAIEYIIASARAHSQKSIIFLTGVPGAGKTLVGLNTAVNHQDPQSALHTVFLSGNGPLVAILREALTRDKVQRDDTLNVRTTKADASRQIKTLIQNIHHFRDDCLSDPLPPRDHVALFDEAQRAWNKDQTSKFMRTKKGHLTFDQSEPEFLISCLDRHPDWAVIVCLVGGGQEINTGEAGISEWLDTLRHNFPHWHIHISSRLTDAEYAAGTALQQLQGRPNVAIRDELHLGVSMRSFRAEHVSTFVKNLLDLNLPAAQAALQKISPHYPLFLTRSLDTAKQWLRANARGNERFGIVASSSASRLKPLALDITSPLDPVHWFLNDKSDVRSSYYLEDVATEFHVQGLELDWTCLAWDADLRHSPTGWTHHTFSGTKWSRVNQPTRQTYLLNAYRVLLTRARQGMILFVPHGSATDPTRPPSYYDPTFHYLHSLGIPLLT